MMTRAAVRGLLLTSLYLPIIGFLPGCYESTDVTSHEPGEFKGQSDPLRSGAAMRAKALKERLEMGQIDR